MQSTRLLIFTLLAIHLFLPVPASAKEISKDQFAFDLSWKQKPRFSLKVWGTMKGRKSCKELKATIHFDNTRKKNIAVSKDITVKNYKKNSVVEISEVLKVQGTSATKRYWFVNDIIIDCQD